MSDCSIQWTVACQAPLSMGFSRLEYWSGLPFPSPGDLPKPGIESVSLTSPELAGRFFITSATSEGLMQINVFRCLKSFGAFDLKRRILWDFWTNTLIPTLLLPPWPHSLVGIEFAYNAWGPGSIPGSGRSARVGRGYPLQYSWASLVAQLVKYPPAMWETWVRSLCWEDTRGKGKGFPTAVFWPGVCHGLYSPWVTKSQAQLSNFHWPHRFCVRRSHQKRAVYRRNANEIWKAI